MSFKLTAEEIKLRSSLLAKNKELLKLHKDLVFSNVLSEEEFWEDRRGLLKAQEMILKQKKGPTSALVSDDLKPVTSTNTNSSAGAISSDVKYVLTPTIIQTIFQQHPILKRAFSELVKITGENEDKQLSEREFWIEYFKSKFFNESVSSQQKSGGSVHLDPFFHDESIAQESSKELIVKVSNQLDISRSEEDHVSDYIRYEREASANGSAWNSLRQFNKHSLRVLEATRSDNKELINDNSILSYNYIEIPDLREFHQPAMVPLNVQESQLFSSAISGENKNISSVDKDKDKDKRSVVDLKRDLKLCLDAFEEDFNPDQFLLNYHQHKNIFTDLYERNNFVSKSENLDLNISDQLDDSESEPIHQLINSCTEILRHFWKSASQSSSGANTTKAIPSDRAAKLTRMISVLEKMESKFKEFDNKAQGAFGNLQETIDRAKLKYSEIFSISTIS